MSWVKVRSAGPKAAAEKLTIDDVELKAPKEWDGLFGVVDGWSGGAGADSELYG